MLINTVQNSLRAVFPDAESRKEKRDLYDLVSEGAGLNIKNYLLQHPDDFGSTQIIWFAASSKVDLFMKSGQQGLSEQQKKWLAELKQQKKILAMHRVLERSFLVPPKLQSYLETTLKQSSSITSKPSSSRSSFSPIADNLSSYSPPATYSIMSS